MEPILFGLKGMALDMAAKQSTQLFLLAKQDKLEVIRQIVAADRPLRFSPGDEDSFEFVFVIRGSLCQLNNAGQQGRTLESGDFLTIHGLKEKAFFRTLTEVEFLYITNAPVFYGQKKKITAMLAWAQEIADKDYVTGEHLFRLQEIVVRMGRNLGLTDEQLFHLVYAAAFHDAGKKNVDSTILTKPRPLDTEEWSIMRQHPLWGRDLILEELGQEFSRVAEIVYQHHERWDGTGYPRGLKGDEILLEAQMLAVADAYDAMTAVRPYQDALSPEEAVERLGQSRGEQFAPAVLDTFLALEPDFRQWHRDQHNPRPSDDSTG